MSGPINDKSDKLCSGMRDISDCWARLNDKREKFVQV